ncbi:MAG: VanW family protein [Longimicrobiales bacterium]|nr:VanW family protein [Longimicrobiales bacterium]
MLRTILPQPVKLALRLARRFLADVRSGHRRRFAGPPEKGPGSDAPFVPAVRVTQPVLNATTELSRINKVHNMRIAVASIEEVVVRPGEIFSFYHTVGRPSRAKGFREGINIVNGSVVEDFGGGLCQLSSIIYHASLCAGLQIVERTNHSVDLYHDRPRYTPLGADATVFYGYKDLRIGNDTAHSVRFRFEVGETSLTCIVESVGDLREHDVTFETVHEDERGFRVVSKRGGEPVAVSTYRKG